MKHLKRYLLGSTALAAANFLPGYYLKQDLTATYTASLLWESTGVFIVSMVASARWGERYLWSCIVAAIFLGPFVGGCLELLSRFLVR